MQCQLNLAGGEAQCRAVKRRGKSTRTDQGLIKFRLPAPVPVPLKHESVSARMYRASLPVRAAVTCALAERTEGLARSARSSSCQ